MDAGRVEEKNFHEEESDDEEEEDISSDINNRIAGFFSNQGLNKQDHEPDDIRFSVDDEQDVSETQPSPSKNMFEPCLSCDDDEHDKFPPKFESQERFVASPPVINLLIQRKFIMVNTDVDTKIHIEPTGSPSNIIAYGISRKLDPEQQVAFEVLAATVVMSFVQDSKIESERCGDHKTADDLDIQLSQLRKLVKKKSY